jgi:MFS family permease
MTAQPQETLAQPRPAALAEPTTPVRARWVALLVLANLAVWMGFFTPIQELLPNQVDAIDHANKVTMLGWVTGAGALAALLANPIAGALSDRTAGRFGRRHPWTLGGALIGAGGLVLLSTQQTIVGVALCWVAVQVCFNGMLAALTAAVPDRVPVNQRGAVSGWVGIPQVLGVVLGVVLVTTVFTGIRAGYLAVAVAVAVLVVPFVLFSRDDRLPREHRPRLSWRSFWVSPRRYPDFAWTFGTRFLVQLGNSLGTLYLLYFLQDRVGLAEGDEANNGLLVLILIYTAGIMATTVVAGRISDRSGRRKRHVIVAGVVMAVAAVILAVWPVWIAAMIAAAVMGAGFGIYVSVDQALITQVLPAAADRAKDLGIINIAIVAPGAVGAALAGALVSLGSYPTLFAGTAVVAAVGSILVWKIKSVP